MKKYIYFTGTDTTKQVMKALGAEDANTLNITHKRPIDEQLIFDKDDLVFVGFPIYGGRVPAIVFDRLRNLQGSNCKLIVVGVYGNRHYDDALKEMQSFAEKHGCSVVAAIAAVAQHNIATGIATGRPDTDDRNRLREIAAEIDAKLAAGELKPMPCRPEETYKEFNGVPVHPAPTESCTNCGICAEECPTQAISHDDPNIVDDSRCITCMRCTYVCPSQARQLPPQMQEALTTRLSAICTTRREIEVFWT